MNRWLYQGGKLLFLASVSLSLNACLSDTSYAPVVNAMNQTEALPAHYTVRKKETIYSIAWTFGLDYRALAAANGLKSPYAIHPGEQLKLRVSPQVAYAATKPSTSLPRSGRERVVKVYSAKSATTVPKIWPGKPVYHWLWPARGRVVQGFSPKLAGNRGLDIAGRLGEPIRAAASGEVVYSGDGVRGYGNLLIIKHNDSYLSAYAFNKKLLVKLGQHVRAGQSIAEMGRNNAGRVLLHFEIRKNGRPVNPTRYLHS